MLINLRNALMAGKRLPYDAEVEYLESTGTQWIDTGVVLNQSSAVELGGRAIANVGFSFFGSRVAYNSRGFIIARFSAGWLGSQYGSLQATRVLPVDDKWHVFRQIKEKFSIDEVHTYDYTYQTFDTPHSALLFCQWNGTAPAPLGQMQISYCKIWDANGILVRDFIPVRKGTVGYLYDRVSGALFGNAGTGDFVVGPDVVPVEYIESHGTEYIDTGYIPNQQTRWELDYQFSTIGSGSNGMFQENPTVRFNIGQGTDRFFNISYGANNALNIASDTLRHLFVADIPNLQWRLDSSSGAFPAPVSTALQYSLRIFCRNSPGGTVYNRHSGRCFASRMYQSNALSQKLLPVRIGTEGAMMDTLTRRIYRNAGTGAFAYGNDLKYPIPAE